MPFFQNPIGLLGLLALPAIVALHLFRRRFRPHPVSALFLWDAAPSSQAAGRRRERLLTSPSLWLELLAALALSLALAGPRSAWVGAAEHLVCVLDDSASMGAVSGETAVRDRACEELRARIDRLPRGSRVTLVTTGVRPRILAGPAALPEVALAATESWRPIAPRHDAAPALALALELSGSRTGGVLFVTDRYEPETCPDRVEIVALGRPLDNAAILHAARARDGEDDAVERVFASVLHRGARPLRTSIRLFAGERELVREELQLEPGGRRDLELVLTEGAADEVFELELGGDALAVDDRAFLAPMPPRTVALAVALEDETARRLGLWSGDESAPRSDRWLELSPHTVASSSIELAHVVLAQPSDANGSDSPAPTGSSAWYLELLGADAQAPRDWIGPFLAEKHHPLLAGTTLEGLVWSAATELVLPGAPLVSAGDQALLTEEFDDLGRRTYRLNLDPARSTLARSPDWPILLANLVELRRSELPGPERTNVALGEAFVWRDRAPGTYLLSGPDRTALELAARGVLVVDDFDRPGVWELSRDGLPLCRVAVSFQDAAESDLTASSSGRRLATATAAAVAASFGWLEAAFVVLALLALYGDWAWLARNRLARNRGASAQRAQSAERRVVHA